MKKLLLAVLLCAASYMMIGQDYNSAIGVRGGFFGAVSYKAKLNDYSAAEGIAIFQYSGLILTGLYTIQNPWTLEGEQFEWYYGGGAHLGFPGRTYSDADYDGGLVLGVDAVIGTEYTFRNAPINISLDYKPAFNLIGINGLAFDGFSLGIRYVLR